MFIDYSDNIMDRANDVLGKKSYEEMEKILNDLKDLAKKHNIVYKFADKKSSGLIK